MTNNKILESIIKDRPNPLMLEESKFSFLSNFILDFCKSINCSKSSKFCNNCEDCKKIEQGKYFDLYIVNFYDGVVKKEEVLKLMEALKYSSLEKVGNKFFILQGIEKASKQITNLMLRTIENPFKNTYFIFTTRNKNAVLETIKSRCFTYKLKGQQDLVNDILKRKEIDPKYFDYLLISHYEIEEMLNFYDSKSFTKIIEFSIRLKDGKNNPVECKKNLNDFKKMTYYEIEKILYYFLNLNQNSIDIYRMINDIKLNINKTLIFNKLLDEIK